MSMPLKPRLWYHPRNLPHFDAASVTHAITYRLSDSLPRHVAERQVDELTDDAEPRYRQRIEAYLDAGHGCGCLTNPAIAQDIIETWRRFDAQRYHLRTWVIMPNHVHVLITMIPGHALGTVVQSWKSWTGKRIKALTGTVAWQRDYWDRYIRDERHYLHAADYIHQNPVKAGLCHEPKAWPWSSAAWENPEKGELGLASPGENPGRGEP
jgi:REP element-mobilizing transposase RayT